MVSLLIFYTNIETNELFLTYKMTDWVLIITYDSKISIVARIEFYPWMRKSFICATWFVPGWCCEPYCNSWSHQLHSKWRMDISRVTSVGTPSEKIHMLYWAISRNCYYFSYSKKNSLLHVQHSISLHDDVNINRFIIIWSLSHLILIHLMLTCTRFFSSQYIS